MVMAFVSAPTVLGGLLFFVVALGVTSYAYKLDCYWAKYIMDFLFAPKKVI